MPVKRRVEKRRSDPRAEAEAWDCLFDTGHDFFGDLPEIPVWTDQYNTPKREEVEAAWHRLGHIFLSQRAPDAHRVPWALRQFGVPSCR